ncbi:MAG: PilZ domain-containing protein, partial [Terracidiphilus sp.]
RKDTNQYPCGESSSAALHGMEPVRHCAYNQSRGRFLSAEVDAADFTTASLDCRLPALAADSDAGLWVVPYRAISPTSVRVPVDLIYLDLNYRVIETVGSFPLARVPASTASSASVLVLPADTISSTETRRGDQLILCEPDEMKRRLQKLASSAPEIKPEPSPAAAKEEPTRAGRVLQWEDRVRPKNPAEKPQAEIAPVEESVSQEAAVEPAAPVSQAQETPAALEAAQKPAQPARSWLQRLLSPEPPQPRKAQRESLHGLSAYFFTGGTPVAHEVRDISLTGMYVFTTERWYPGTMVRMTLTDRHDPSLERSITLHATVMRSGEDGVGLKFVLQNPKDRRRGADGMDVMQVEEFLQKLRSPNG